MTERPALILWGFIASPYLLKMQALADYCGLSWQRWPEQAGSLQALRFYLLLGRGQRRQSIARYPARVEGMDEYPAVPYYSLDCKTLYYDSTGLARHLDGIMSSPTPLIPADPQLRFVCQLIDEAFDEFGLYMVHHNRWVTSAATNVMGEMTSREMPRLLPAFVRRRIARDLPRRQVRRCPYLFSVAPTGVAPTGVAPADPAAGLAEDLIPPGRPGFPPTHELLDTAWRRYLGAMEQLLAHQPYLLGDRFTLADASAYGQLSMNLVDGRAAELLEELAPRTFAWLCAIRDGDHRASHGELQLTERLDALLDIIGSTFLPLMQQNDAAYRQARSRGQTLFNEAAFDRGEALYNGELLGRPFRSVAKSFQVVVWQDLCAAWHGLAEEDRAQLQARYPALASADFGGNPQA